MIDARKEHLRQYFLACVRDNVLSWSDFMKPDLFNRLLETLSKDAHAVVLEMGRDGAPVLAAFATSVGQVLVHGLGAKLMKLAEDVSKRKGGR
jgi:hypothetical protein